ncbi:antitrypsin-like [Camponotus floridanus]|uniref:antitrypsin-like n=1 Tax=Camponotus floridanus TaxID=104421 RepID=UPI000DC6CE31|nr:antitrypsin-like [Camponotus floridanus]
MRTTALFMIIITISTLIICSKDILFIEEINYRINTFPNVSAAFITYLEFKLIPNERFPKPTSEADLFTLLSLLLQDVHQDDEAFIIAKMNMYLASLLEIVYKVAPNYKYKTLIQLLKKRSDIKNDLHIANAIYVSNKIKLSSQFLSMFNNIFKIPISNINFKNNIHVAKTFSLWAQKATNNKILDVILPRKVEEDTTFVLVTGVYFNNRLLDAFDVEKRRFDVSQTESYYVPMIKFKKSLYNCAYIQNWHTIFIEIPLDKNITMIIFLPTRKINLEDLERMFNFFIFEEYKKNLKEFERYTSFLELYLPKFKFEITHSLQHALRKRNLNKTIKITQSSYLNVKEIIQKVSIEFNQNRSVITTATRRKSKRMASNSTAKFVIDRPFMFAIEINGIVLYAGSVRKPNIF